MKRILYHASLGEDGLVDAFDALLEVSEVLYGPGGCPWDRQQTFRSLQPYVLEEAHEVVEAVDGDRDAEIIEELGDLFYTVIFYGKIAEKAGRFSVRDIVEAIREKLIRRHPHVFAGKRCETIEDVKSAWEQVKKEEKKDSGRISALDGIPPTLPTLIKAQKILKRIVEAKAPIVTCADQKAYSEEEIGARLIQLILSATRNEIEIESALRRSLSQCETDFRAWEKEV